MCVEQYLLRDKEKDRKKYKLSHYYNITLSIANIPQAVLKRFVWNDHFIFRFVLNSCNMQFCSANFLYYWLCPSINNFVIVFPTPFNSLKYDTKFRLRWYKLLLSYYDQRMRFHLSHGM